MEAQETSEGSTRLNLFAVLLAAAAVALVLFGFSQRRKRARAPKEAPVSDFASRVNGEERAALALDSFGKIVAANLFAVLALDYPRDRLLGRALRDLVAPDSLPTAQANVACAMQGGAVGFEVTFRAKGGRRVPAEAKAAPLDAAEPSLGALISFRETVVGPALPQDAAVSGASPDR